MQLIYNYNEYYEWISKAFYYESRYDPAPLIDESEMLDFCNKSQPESYPCLAYLTVSTALSPFPTIKFIYKNQIHEWSQQFLVASK